jgi:hypothetical protein
MDLPASTLSTGGYEIALKGLRDGELRRTWVTLLPRAETIKKRRNRIFPSRRKRSADFCGLLWQCRMQRHGAACRHL